MFMWWAHTPLNSANTWKKAYKIKRRENKVASSNSPSHLEEDNGVNDLSEETAEIAILYEAEIGKITSVVTQERNDTIQNYPAAWIKDAIKEDK